MWPGDAWGATATLTASESGVYELAFYGETPSLTLGAAEQSGARAFCPERGYCRMALTAGDIVTIAAHYQVAAVLDGTPLRVRVWGSAPGGAEIHATERPAARSVALPFIGGP